MNLYRTLVLPKFCHQAQFFSFLTYTNIDTRDNVCYIKVCTSIVAQEKKQITPLVNFPTGVFSVNTPGDLTW